MYIYMSELISRSKRLLERELHAISGKGGGERGRNNMGKNISLIF